MKFLSEVLSMGRRRVALEAATVIAVGATTVQNVPCAPVLWAYVAIVGMNVVTNAIRFAVAVWSVRLSARVDRSSRLALARFLLSAFDYISTERK